MRTCQEGVFSKPVSLKFPICVDTQLGSFCFHMLSFPSFHLAFSNADILQELLRTAGNKLNALKLGPFPPAVRMKISWWSSLVAAKVTLVGGKMTECCGCCGWQQRDSGTLDKSPALKRGGTFGSTGVPIHQSWLLHKRQPWHRAHLSGGVKSSC